MIYKPHPCAFTDTPLDAHLKQLGKSKIVLVGEFGPLLLPDHRLHSLLSEEEEEQKPLTVLTQGIWYHRPYLPCFPLFSNL